MRMLFQLAHEITFFIKTAVFRRVFMFLQLAFQLFGHCIAVICVMMSFGLLLTADQLLRIATVVMLVSFDSACGLALHGDRRQYKRIRGYKHDNSRNTAHESR